MPRRWQGSTSTRVRPSSSLVEVFWLPQSLAMLGIFHSVQCPTSARPPSKPKMITVGEYLASTAEAGRIMTAMKSPLNGGSEHRVTRNYGDDGSRLGTEYPH